MAFLPPVRLLGIAWYSPDTFKAVRALMVDAADLHPTYEAFRRQAEQLEDQIRRSGIAVIRVTLDTEKFPTFCRDRGLPLNSDGRTAYASHVAAETAAMGSAGNA